MRRIDSGVLGCLAASLLVLCGLMGCGGTPTTGMDASKGVDVPKQTDAPKQTASQEGVQVLKYGDFTVEIPASWSLESKGDADDTDTDTYRSKSGSLMTLNMLEFTPEEAAKTTEDEVISGYLGGFEKAQNWSVSEESTGKFGDAKYWRWSVDVKRDDYDAYAELVVNSNCGLCMMVACPADGSKEQKQEIFEIMDSVGGNLDAPVFKDSDNGKAAEQDKDAEKKVEQDAEKDAGGEEAGGFVATTLSKLGSFPAQTIEGAGDDVVEIPCAGFPCVIDIVHNGESNFAVKACDSTGNSVKLLVNEIGYYRGTVTTVAVFDEASLLQVKADGGWAMTFKPMSQMERAENGSAFKGDGVVYIDTASLTKVHFTHNGSSNFAVKGISLSSEKLLVNEIGPYDGTVIWNEPQSFFVVSADGDWSISW